MSTRFSKLKQVELCRDYGILWRVWKLGLQCIQAGLVHHMPRRYEGQRDDTRSFVVSEQNKAIQTILQILSLHLKIILIIRSVGLKMTNILLALVSKIFSWTVKLFHWPVKMGSFFPQVAWVIHRFGTITFLLTLVNVTVGRPPSTFIWDLSPYFYLFDIYHINGYFLKVSKRSFLVFATVAKIKYVECHPRKYNKKFNPKEKKVKILFNLSLSVVS